VSMSTRIKLEQHAVQNTNLLQTLEKCSTTAP
jgi:hypothetical protein